MRTPHDQLFKELLSTFFQEFLQLFLPQLMEYVEPDSLILLDKELYTQGLRRVSRQGDLVVKARVRGQPSYILIHLDTSRALGPISRAGCLATSPAFTKMSNGSPSIPW